MAGITRRKRKDVLHIKLPDSFEGPAVAELKDAVSHGLQVGMTVRLNAEAVERVSTPAIQMMLAVAAFIERQEAEFRLAAPSETLVEAFSDLGLFANLMSWNVD